MVTTAKRVEDGFVVEKDSKTAVPIVPGALLKEARSRWDEFEGSLRSSLSKAIALGKSLLAIKEECGHGNFGRYFSDHEDPEGGALPFSRKWAHRLMVTAANETVSNVQHAGHLPADLQTIYELATMTAPALEAAIEAGKVTPQMTRAEAKELKRESEPVKERAHREAPRRTDKEALADCYAEIMDTIAATIADHPKLKAPLAARLELLAKELMQ